jgi:hypothetical protein
MLKPFFPPRPSELPRLPQLPRLSDLPKLPRPAGLPRLLRRAALCSLTLAAVPGPVTPPGLVTPGPPATGGWTAQDPASPQMHAVAAFVARDLSQEFARRYVVEDITSAESQVVAGTNYQLSLRLAQLQDDVLGARKDCTAVIYQPLPGQGAEQLTSFDCQTVPEPTATTVHM